MSNPPSGPASWSSGTWAHEAFDDILSALSNNRKITRDRIADVVRRFMVAAPRRPSQSEIAAGRMLVVPNPIAADSVSRVVTSLNELGMVEESAPRSDRPGRPYKPLRFGSEQWAVIGVTIERQAGRAARLCILATTLDGSQIRLPHEFYAEGEHVYTRTVKDARRLVDELGDAIGTVCESAPLRERLVLGVGVAVAGHVSDGVVMDGTLAGVDHTFDLGSQLSERLDLGRRLVEKRIIGRRIPFPVVVDNDLHAIGVLETYQPRFAELDWLVAAVFDNGVGSGPIIGGRIYRGARGMSGEIGHTQIRFGDRETDETHTGEGPPEHRKLPGFHQSCECDVASTRHLDCFATPSRMLGELGYPSFDQRQFEGLAARQADETDSTTIAAAARVFRTAGRALGIALANTVNLFDPSRILLYLPPALAEAAPDSNAELYLRGVRDELRLNCFSDGASGTKVTLRSLPSAERSYLSAKAASVRVVDGFVLHARGRCRCYVLQPHDAGTDSGDGADETRGEEDLMSLRREAPRGSGVFNHGRRGERG